MEQLIHLQVQKLLLYPKQVQRSPEWFEMRKERLTSSDVDTVLGRNPYSKAEDVLFKKCGLSKPFTGNAATRHGQRYEDEAIDIYCKMYKKHAFSFGMIPHETIPFLGGSPDDITHDGIVIEVKCPLQRKIIMGEVPKYYWGQVQLNMEICNLDQAVFIEYRPASMNENNEMILNVVNVPRDRAWFQEVFPTLKSFWDSVLLYRSIGIDKHPMYATYARMNENNAFNNIPDKPCEIESDVEDLDC